MTVCQSGNKPSRKCREVPEQELVNLGESVTYEDWFTTHRIAMNEVPM